MGIGIEVKCSECGYEEAFHLGVGMGFPFVYQRTIGEIEAGLYGDEWKEFFENEQNAVINCEREVYQCTQCNHLESDYNLGLYKLHNGKVPSYWAKWIYNKDEYTFVKSYYHKCPECGRRMHKVSEYTRTIPCPICGKTAAVISDDFYWD